MGLICALDLETTGIDHAEHRVIEIYAGLWDMRTKSLIRQISQRFDPQRSIQAEASRVHHIYAGDLVGCPILDNRYAVYIRSLIQKADFVVAHNGVEFDIPFLNAEFARVGLGPIERPCFDTMLLGRHATFNGKVPTLGELCLAYDVPYDPEAAHAADYDVKVMMECFFKGVEWGSFRIEDVFDVKLIRAA
jgi:DNA polymerase-3 subunit epsilon